MEEEFDYGFVDEQDLMAMGTFIEEPEIFFYEEEVFFEPIFREEEVYLDPLPDIYELPIELVALTPFEQPFELTMRLEEEFFPEELIELEEIEEYFEPEYEEEIEELVAELEEPEIEEVIEIEVEAVTVGKIDEKSGITQTQLDVVAQTVSAAANSVSGTTAGTEVHATSSNSFDMSISTNGGGMQNLTELGSEAVVTTTVSVAVNNTEQAAVDNVQQVDKSEADTIADNIIAQNLEDQAEQVIEERATTDEYGDEANLIAYINYLPGFDMYTKTIMLDKTSWYESKVIYPVSLVDNTAAFTSLNGNSFNKLNKMINLQPNL
jgi:chitodextrinase